MAQKTYWTGAVGHPKTGITAGGGGFAHGKRIANRSAPKITSANAATASNYAGFRVSVGRGKSGRNGIIYSYDHALRVGADPGAKVNERRLRFYRWSAVRSTYSRLNTGEKVASAGSLCEAIVGL
eukprot:scaffold99484_cov63-Phaeocystis_antarctica.AAC.4